MKFPCESRVVVVDDRIDEASTLLNALNKKGVSTLYYSGALDTLPDKPLTGVRYLFLDIELDGSAGASVENKSSTLLSVVNKLIDCKDNGPLVIVFWTADAGVVKDFLPKLVSGVSYPVFHAVIKKSECRLADESNEEKFDINKIAEKLKQEIPYGNSLSFYIQWESSVHNALLRMGSSLYKGLEQESDVSARAKKWNDSLLYTIYSMGGGIEKDKVVGSIEDCTKEALRQYGVALADSIDRTLSQVKPPENLKVENVGELDTLPNIKGSVNSFLLIGEETPTDDSSVLQPGAVRIYDYNELDDKLQLLREMLIARYGVRLKCSNECRKCKTEKMLDCKDEIQLCSIVITPPCDVANNKMILLRDGTPCCRVVYGLIVSNLDKVEDKDSPIRKGCGPESMFATHEFVYRSRTVAMFLGFETISVVSKTELVKHHVSFIIREGVLFDIMSKAANHVNRLGNSLV